MTIPRKPVTFARAMEEIASLLGWDGCGEVLDKSESQVRKLGAPGTDREISLRDAVRLDTAYIAAGGEGAPLLECYALKLNLRVAKQQDDVSCMLTGAAKAAKESGEAVAAAIDLAGRVDDPKARLNACREIEEAITELTRLLARVASAV